MAPHRISALFCLVLVSITIAFSQERGFPFGKVSKNDLELKHYEKDTSARAFYMDEFGEAFFNTENYNLVFRYHAKIKILKSRGLDLADIEIPLYKSGTNYERVRDIRASSFSLEGNTIQEAQFDSRKMIVEKKNKYWDICKIAIPKVKVGSIIEIYYEKETPWVFNFHPWEFQSDIPKVRSEYTGLIPATHIYNITLKGFLKLTKNESEVSKYCLGSATSAMSGGFSADCMRFTYVMENIPAFVEEDFMTAKKNFISSIHFELAEFRKLSGGVDKITKEWKDAEMELRKHEKFGIELKRADNLLKDEIALLAASEVDPLLRAKKIYRYIQGQLEWNSSREMFSDGIKEAIQSKKGNAADINLLLTAALREQDFDADPVILSTRDNGTPNDLYPVLTDFNYVICRLVIKDKTYLLDATDDFHPFGVLPERCLNGKGRLLDEDGSSWIELKPGDRGRNLAMINVKLDEDGMIRGTVRSTYMGYEAINFRKRYYEHNSHEEYSSNLKKKLSGMEIKNVEVENIDDIEKAVIQNLEVEIEAFDGLSNSFLFNPFLLNKWQENPFKSSERLYPVDFGTPMEMTTILNLQYPAGYEIVNVPEKVGLALPNAGGRFIVEAKGLDSSLTFTNSLQINKTVYSSQEYHFLKELFNKVIEVENSDLLFKKKT